MSHHIRQPANRSESLYDAEARRALRLLFGRSHVRTAAALWTNRFTARSWATGHRRIPTPVLEHLRGLLQAYAADAWSLHAILGTLIETRRGEPSRHGLGFRAVDPLTGRDKRWRLGGRVRRPSTTPGPS